MNGFEGLKLDIKQNTKKSYNQKPFNSPKEIVKNINTKEYISEKIEPIINELGLIDEDENEIIEYLLEISGNNKEKLKKIIREIENNDFISTKEDILKLIKKETNLYKKETNLYKKEINLDKKKNEEEKNITEKQKNIIDNLQNSIKGLDENDLNYGNIVKQIKNFDIENGNFDDIQDILNNFKKSPGKLLSVVKDLGGTKNNPQYNDFKDSLTVLDENFLQYFEDIEKIDSGRSLDVNNVIEGIEKNTPGIIDINLGEKPPNSSIRIIGSEYSFKEPINTQKLNKISQNSDLEMQKIDISLSIINDFEKDFHKDNFSLEDILKLYKDYPIKESDKITQIDLNSFKEAKTKEEKIFLFEQNIKSKIFTIKEIIENHKNLIIKKYTQQIKDLVSLENKKEKQKIYTLKFIHSIGFDRLPQGITNQIITEIKSNRLIIPGLDLDRSNIDISNGNFGEKGLGEKEGNVWKTNMVQFMEKMIYGTVGAEGSIFKGKEFKGMFGAFINPLELNNELEKSGVKTGNGYDIEKIRTNLKKQNTDTENKKVEK